jgi:hypothetical protein
MPDVQYRRVPTKLLPTTNYHASACLDRGSPRSNGEGIDPTHQQPTGAAS